MVETSTNEHGRQRIPALDGFRGLAILMVTIYRFAQLSLGSDVIGEYPSKMILIGAVGVDFFFVLSGFLITGILLDTKSNPKGYFRNFYVRRALRIFPLYYGSLILFLFLFPRLCNIDSVEKSIQGSQVHLWFYTLNLGVAWRNEWCYGSLNHYWSLAIEEQFYLLWPFVVLYLPSRGLMRLSLVLLVGFAALRIGSSACGIGEVTEKSLTIFRLDGLLLGAIAACWLRNSSAVLKNHHRWRLALIITGILYAATLFLGGNDLTVRYTIVSLFAAVLLLTVLAARPDTYERIFLENPVLRSLGKYSYAMYVFQLPLIGLVDRWISPDALRELCGYPVVAGLAYVALMTGITYLLAVCSWHGFESYFLRRGDSSTIESSMVGSSTRSLARNSTSD
jgi:peptidoglycan/LPS O-acetylase OafA/YrhL